MRVAIVGSRPPKPDAPPELRERYAALVKRVWAYVGALDHGTVIVSGNCRGVDRAAEAAARTRGFEVMSFPAQWNRDDGTFDRGAGFARNATIVANADRLAAFTLGTGGTANTIALARKRGIPVEVFE